MKKDLKQVNSSIPKIDGMGLVKGKPAYTQDLIPSNILIVKTLKSPHAFAKVLNVNYEEALKVEGIEAIFSWKDVPQTIITRAGQGFPEPSPYDRYILNEYVRHVGDEVAIVAGETEEAVEEALKLIKVDYEVLEAVLDLETAVGHSSIIHPEKEAFSMFPIGFDANKNIAAAYEMHVGDVDDVIAKSEVKVEGTYFTQAQAQVPLEPHNCFTYVDFHGRLNVITSTQTPVHIRRIMGRALSMPLKKIRVFKPRVGGGFGGKQMLHGELFCAMVTLKTGKAAKMIYTRKEVFESTCCRHAMRFNLRVASDKEGYIKAIDMDVLSDTGAYGEHALTVLMVAGSKTLPLYNKVEAVRFNGVVCYTNHTPAGAYRGYGALQANFALESLLDELAEKLGISTVELHKKNMISEGESSPIFKIMGEGSEGVDMNVESCKLDYCLDRSIELIGWENKYPRKEIAPNKVRGVGLAIAMQGSGIAHIDMGSAILKLNDDGFFNLLMGATDIGTGSDTILAQVAAEAIGISASDIVVYSSDTDLTPFDTGAYASSTTYVTGNAVRKAGLNMRKLLIETVAKKFKVTPEEVTFENGVFTTEKESITLKEFSTRLYYNEGLDQKQLVASDSYVGEQSPPPFMVGVAEVEVDTETGFFTILDYAAVVDCGTTLNPNLAKIQVEGGLMQGIGMAVYEDVVYTSSGRMLTNNLMTYKIPTREDVKKLTVEFADSYDPSGPYGAKSVGEIGIDTPPAAIANAIYNAVGVRIKTLPITPEKVLMALKLKEK
ncbi:molybdopterin-dependent oxidoreductase [bacterium]|nr:molybdopterin-dependent oxidoreductase [bacterium]